MKKITIIALISILIPSVAVAKIRIDNKSDAWVFVTSEWDLGGKKDLLLAPNSTQTITQDGALIKRKFTVKFVEDPEIIPPYDFTDPNELFKTLMSDPSQAPEIQARLAEWRNNLQTATELVPQNGTLDQIVTIFGAVDPKTQRFNLRAVNKIAQDADKE